MSQRVCRFFLRLGLLLLVVGLGARPSGQAAAAAGPDGQLTFAIHVTPAPTWFDPADTTSRVTGHPYSSPYEDLKLNAK